MGTDPSRQRPASGLPAVELWGTVGFGLHLGWLLIVSFWLFCEPSIDAFVTHHAFIQLWLFVGNALGFIVLALLARLPRFNLFAPAILLIEGIGGLLLPALALLPLQGHPASEWIVCVGSFLTGAVSASLTVSWLDVCSRLRTKMYGRFTGASFLIGSLTFIIAAVAPGPVDALLAAFYALASLLLVVLTGRNATGNEERAPLASTKSGWRFQKEVEPSLFVFGITFGMTFAWLFTAGQTAVLIGLCAIIPGALCITLLSVFHVQVNITMVLRILLCLCVFACVFMPQSNDVGRLICSCLIIAAWSMFTALNYAFIVRKSVVMRDSPCFRKAPMRLSIPASGFAVGWLVIYAATCLFGEGADEFIAVRLFFAVLLVVVFALFFPSQEHHSMDDSSATPIGLDERETFDLRIRGIAKRFGLSPREIEVARFLARGRNAAFIQEQLVVSPHTVRSHMYNIYKKLGVHSQQEVIDLAERFPIDVDDYA